MKMNNKRAPRTRKILEADVVAQAESETEIAELVRLSSSSGVCVVGMYKSVQLRNLGDPSSSKRNIGKIMRIGMQALIEERMEVRLLHSIEEVR